MTTNYVSLGSCLSSGQDHADQKLKYFGEKSYDKITERVDRQCFNETKLAPSL